jgi:hypothetical protein
MTLVTVLSVEVLGHYRLRLTFSDGGSRDVDLTGQLIGPVFEPLANPDFFAQVRVDEELGTVAWPNGADLDPLVLHGDFEPAPPTRHKTFSRLSEQVGAQLAANGVGEQEVLDDFAASRNRR